MGLAGVEVPASIRDRHERCARHRHLGVGVNSMLPRISLVICACLLVSATAFGQGLGTISGNVTDPSGAVIVGAQVRAMEMATGISRTVPTDAQGAYVMSAMRPADYTITVEAPGFR